MSTYISIIATLLAGLTACSFMAPVMELVFPQTVTPLTTQAARRRSVPRTATKRRVLAPSVPFRTPPFSATWPPFEELETDERVVLEHYYGLTDGREHTRWEICRELDMDLETVRSIRNRALRKFRRPELAQPYRAMVETANMVGMELESPEFCTVFQRLHPQQPRYMVDRQLSLYRAIFYGANGVNRGPDLAGIDQQLAALLTRTPGPVKIGHICRDGLAQPLWGQKLAEWPDFDLDMRLTACVRAYRPQHHSYTATRETMDVLDKPLRRRSVIERVLRAESGPMTIASLIQMANVLLPDETRIYSTGSAYSALRSITSVMRVARGLYQFKAPQRQASA